ncbi:MucR family transcriptional regulator [Sphingobium yanoikuyae]|uniref:MucR family transcriptional regulator n=1 Tax=Sphingobium yanoikuyae TaxID=13690 RepID=UPI003D766D50
MKPDYLVCLEDGRRVKMLKRYLSTRYNLTPAEYRTKWSLPPDYPMVAPSYAERRRELAHSIGLGRKRKPVAELATPIPEPKSEMKADGVDAPRRHRCARVEVLNTTEGGVRVAGYHNRAGYCQDRFPRARRR